LIFFYPNIFFAFKQPFFIPFVNLKMNFLYLLIIILPINVNSKLIFDVVHYDSNITIYEKIDGGQNIDYNNFLKNGGNGHCETEKLEISKYVDRNHYFCRYQWKDACKIFHGGGRGTSGWKYVFEDTLVEIKSNKLSDCFDLLESENGFHHILNSRFSRVSLESNINIPNMVNFIKRYHMNHPNDNGTRITHILVLTIIILVICNILKMFNN